MDFEIRQEIERELPKASPVDRALKVGEAKSYRRVAIQEIISDTLSAHVFGPSCLFALYEVAGLSRSMDVVSQDLHPPWRYRLRQMLSVLEELQFIEKEQFALKCWPPVVPPNVLGAKPKVDDWLKSLKQIVLEHTDLEEIKKEVHVRCAYRSVEEAIPSIREFASRNVTAPYTPKFFADEVPGLLDRIYMQLPPNQIEYSQQKVCPVRLASILASGWIYKVAELTSFSQENPSGYVTRIRGLNRLILKAIELSAVKSEYDSTFARKTNGPSQ